MAIKGRSRYGGQGHHIGGLGVWGGIGPEAGIIMYCTYINTQIDRYTMQRCTDTSIHRYIDPIYIEV